MNLIKWVNCKFRNKHSMKVMFKNSTLPRCEICFRTQKMINNRKDYDDIFKIITK